MKLYRFMSREEFARITRYESMFSNIDWATRCQSDSEGFCFIGESTDFTSWSHGKPEKYTYSPEQCYNFLFGVVSDEVCVEFETTEAVNVEKSSGDYADPMGLCDDFIIIDEYCVKQYDRETLVPKRYAIPDLDTVNWNWYNVN